MVPAAITAKTATLLTSRNSHVLQCSSCNAVIIYGDEPLDIKYCWNCGKFFKATRERKVK